MWEEWDSCSDFIRCGNIKGSSDDDESDESLKNKLI